MTEALSVAFVASDLEGGGRVRSWWPAGELQRRGWRVRCGLEPPEPGAVDVVVVHRPLDRRRLAMIEGQRAAGTVVLVDEDDALEHIPRSFAWQPPEGALELHDETVAAADGVIVTTAALAARYGPPLGRQTWVVPNYLPGWVGVGRFHGRPMDVRVGWAGIVATHRQDLEWLAPVLRPALGRAVLSLVGDTSALRVLRCGGARHEVFGWQSSPEALYKLMARADVGMVPLAPGPLNEAKSWLKALEYMALGKPVVVADLPEQRRLVEHGVSGFVAAKPEEFAGRVAELVADVELRAAMGAAARERARALTLESCGSVWETTLRDAVARAPRKVIFDIPKIPVATG